jgi:cardiolipin synthase A/B
LLYYIAVYTKLIQIKRQRWCVIIKSSFQAIIYGIIIINAVVSTTIIILERKQPEKTIAWLLIFLMLPPVGLVLYLFLGTNWKLHKLREGYSPQIDGIINRAITKVKNPEYLPLIELLANNSESPLFLNNEIKIFNNGEDKFYHLKQELLKANHHIHLEYYIVKSDTIGNEIKDILIRKSLEGVKVRFIMDRVGSIKLSRSYIKDLKAAGVDVVQYSYFLAPIFRYINTEINYRNHRKIAIIDGKVGFVGGINIGDEYLGKGKLGYWRDTHIMVKGDFVLGLQGVFIEDFITIKEAKKELSLHGENFNDYFLPLSGSDNKIMQLIKSGPDSKYPAIQQGIHKMITMASDHIFITTPYFVPPESILESLKIAALGGVDVRILFPGRYDHITVYYASKTYLSELIKCGVKVYFYNKNSFVHSKVMTIDGKVSTVGTANMDIRSYALNYEINAVIYDQDVTQGLERQFNIDLDSSKLMSQQDFDNVSPYIKALEAVARIFSALL